MALKMGIIGYGGMATWHHEELGRLSEIKVIGAYDIREEAAEKASKKGLKIYNSAEELCADPEIDIVLVATPNDTHKKFSIMALEVGKNVICEKPVTMNTAELEEIIKVRDKSNKLFSTHQNRRWDTDYHKIKKIMADSTLTEPYYVESRVQGSRQNLHGWRGHTLNGGGMLYDWGSHLFDQLLCLFPGKVISVDADLQMIHSDEVDDNDIILIRFDSGVTALVNIAMNCFIKQPRWHMSFKDGTLIIHDWDAEGEIVKINEDATDLEWDEEIVYTAAGPTRTMAPRPKETTAILPLPEIKTDWLDFYRNICDAINGKADQEVKPEQTLRVMKIIDTAFESNKQKCAVKCEI